MELYDFRIDVLVVSKPCGVLGYCPYGPLVELSPLKEAPDDESCSILGHDCPVFAKAESFVDPGAPKIEDLDDEIEDDS